MAEYEHAGEWDCNGCGKTFKVETKIDPLIHALTCGIETSSGARSNRPDGYRRRRQELEALSS